MFDMAMSGAVCYNLAMDIVLFFQSTTQKSWRQKLFGLHAFSQQHGWFVQVVDKFASPREIRKAIRNWDPIGCIVDRAMSKSAPPDHVFGGIPVIYLDQSPEKTSEKHPCLLHDSAASAALVGKELIDLQCASYAYVAMEKEPFWDKERQARFSEDVAKAGGTLVRLPRQDLTAAIKALPKPCGIFGANDSCAAAAYHAAVTGGFRIPDDVAIAGIDNDELFCETVTPGITSVEPDFEGAGYRLGKMLKEEIDRKRRGGRTRHGAHLEFYGPLRLVRRGSTRVRKGLNPRIQRALEYIRRCGCDNGITLDAVAEEMKCSRRMATLEFKKATGGTIFDAIQETRFQKACELLARTNLPIATVVVHCGYKSDSFIKKMFLARTGMTMRKYRKANAR